MKLTSRTVSMLRVWTIVILVVVAAGWFLPSITEYHESLVPDRGLENGSYEEIARIEPSLILVIVTLLRAALLIPQRKGACAVSLALGLLTCAWLLLYPIIWDATQMMGGLYRVSCSLNGFGIAAVALCVLSVVLTLVLFVTHRRSKTVTAS